MIDKQFLLSIHNLNDRHPNKLCFKKVKNVTEIDFVNKTKYMNLSVHESFDININEVVFITHQLLNYGLPKRKKNNRLLKILMINVVF